MKKLFVGLIAVAMLVGVTVSAQTPTMAELQALIAQLSAQLASLQGGSNTGTSAAGACSFSGSLTMGSTGAQVTCLQQYLEAGGYLVMPTGVSYGYFGSLTKSAVASWQAANGVAPAAGYFGPISIAKYNMLAATAPSGGNFPPGCTSNMGFSTTTGQSCAGGALPAGCTPGALFSSTTGQSCTGTTGPTTVTPGTDGSITIGTSALVSSGTAVKKGETRNVLSTRLKATGGSVSVDRVEVKFSERPWLTMNQVQLKSGNGTVLATKTLSGQADATEVTVGSDYRVRFDNVSLVVAPGVDVDLVVAVSVLASSDKITGQTVTLDIPTGGIRTTNGIGFSETIGDTADFTFTLPSSGSNGDIYTSISPNSPTAHFQSIAAGTTQTENVVLGKFRVKSQNQSSTINSMNFNLSRSTSVATTTLFSNVRLATGSLSYGANSLAAAGTTFTNMQIPLPVDQWVELTLTANVAGADSSSGIVASSTLVASGISGIDGNFNSLTVSNASNVTSEDVTFLQNNLTVSGISATGVLVDNGSNPASTSTAAFKFTLTNNSNGPVYVSALPSTFVATSTTASVGKLTLMSADPSTVSGDSSGVHYAINAGDDRVFTLEGFLGNDGGTSQTSELKITKIFFDDDTSGLQENFVDFGLAGLRVATFLNN